MRTYTVGTVAAENIIIETHERISGSAKGRRWISLTDAYTEHEILLSISDAHDMIELLQSAIRFLER